MRGRRGASITHCTLGLPSAAGGRRWHGASVAVAELEVVELAPVSAIVEPELQLVVSAEIDALISERPMPGCFDELGAEAAAAGVEQLAVQAVLCAALESMRRKGWSKDKAIAHVGTLAKNTELLAAYVDLLVSSR